MRDNLEGKIIKLERELDHIDKSSFPLQRLIACKEELEKFYNHRDSMLSQKSRITWIFMETEKYKVFPPSNSKKKEI